MRTVVIYHEDDIIDSEITTRWLASFSTLAGMIVLREDRGRLKARIRREIKRVGPLRFLDVAAYRLYYKLFLSSHDLRWKRNLVSEYISGSTDIGDIPRLVSSSPNSAEVAEFVRSLSADLMIARCKTLLKPEIFSLPVLGTYVLHPGICPEYRNAHGCFWALANADYGKVGLTLLKIDEGVDTGPIYGYFSYPYDALKESHDVIQNRVFTENLEGLAKKFLEIESGVAVPIDTTGRRTGVWGQPWLSAYLRIRRNAGKPGLNRERGGGPDRPRPMSTKDSYH